MALPIPTENPLKGPPMTRPNAPTCDDCYFRRHALCAMAPERPCPTFRAATRTLQPPRQPRLVPLSGVPAAAAVAVAVAVA
jgi:hypothetical protein